MSDQDASAPAWYRLRRMVVAPERFPRAIFLDLDGTLLAPGAVLKRHTVEALWEVLDRGAVLALATGGFSERTRLVARLVGERHPGRVWAITHNGGAVWRPDGTVLHRWPMPRAAVRAALALAGPRLWVTFETVDAAGVSQVYYAGRLRREMIHYVWGPQPDTHPHGEPEAIAVGLEPRWDWRRARSVATATGVLGCWAVGTPAALAPLDAQADGNLLYGARYLPWGTRLGQLLGRPRLRIQGRDIGAGDTSKGAAAAWLCAHLGIDRAETAAFGDGDNDLELLAFAGQPVAMANGTAAVRAAAALIAPPNHADGVAQVLRQWLGRRG